MFASEKALAKGFDEAVADGNAPFNHRHVAHEFNYREGCTDVIASDQHGNIFAFEMKLEKWRSALHQAYRNTSFVHYSYVVLPCKTAEKAVRWRHEFVKRGVGLCSVDVDGIKMEIEAKRLNPLRPWLTQSAINHIADNGTAIL